MNKIYLIFIIACLIEQMKADVYTVELIDVVEGDQSLATVSGESNSTQIVTFLNDVNEGDIKEVFVRFFDFTFRNFYNATLDDPCDMDSSTEDGTIASILWGILGVESCPIKAGDYPANRENFNQTGIIEETFSFVNDLITLKFEPKTQEGKSYFRVSTDVRLVEGDHIIED